MVHEELNESLALYAAGALDRAERQEVDTHLLTGCPACHTDLKDFQHIASLLPYALTPVAPPRTLKAKILAARPQGAPVPDDVKRPLQPSLEPGDWMKHLFPPAPRLPIWTTPAFAVLALIFAASFLYMGYAAYVRTQTDPSSPTTSQAPPQESLEQQIAKLQAQMGEQDGLIAKLTAASTVGTAQMDDLRDRIIQREAEIDDLRNQLAQREKDLATARRGQTQSDEVSSLFKSSAVRTIPLSGSDGGRAAAGLVVFDQTTGKAFFYAYNLPTLAAGQVYQLWAIDVKPISSGTFVPDVGQKGRLSVRGLPPGAHVSKFAVTVEPTGGQPLPSGPIYLSGTL